MRPSDIKAYRNAIAALCLTFGREATEELYDAYWMGVSDLTIEALQTAVATAIRSSKAFPRPVELRQFAGEQTNEQRAIAAWGDVLRAVPRGPYKHIDFQDPLINATVRNLGGWPTFIGRFEDEESEKWVRLEFLKAYQSFASSGVNGEACLPLTGINQVTPIGGIQCTPRPIRIECTPDRMELPCKLLTVRQLEPKRDLVLRTIGELNADAG